MKLIENKTDRNPTFRENAVVSVDGRPYRILSKAAVLDSDGQAVNAHIQMIALDGTRFEIKKTDLLSLKTLFHDGRLTVLEDVDSLPFPNLAEGDRAAVDARYEIIKGYIDDIYPDFSVLQSRGVEKEGLHRVSRLLSITERQARRLILRFLQEGRTKRSLVDGRSVRIQGGYDPKAGAIRGTKAGGQSSEVLNDSSLTANFEEAYRNLAFILNSVDYQTRSKNPPTLTAAYRRMLDEHYSYIDEYGDVRTLPDNQIPSKKRFVRWVRTEKWGGGLARDHLVSKREWNNNRRLLTGDSRHNVHHPGELIEIDETEVSFDMVTADPDRPGQNIGGAIIHLATDVASGVYVAVSVTVQVNNSYEGVLNLFDMLLMDNGEKCRMLGVDGSETVFPGPLIPEKIRVDRGAEYTSRSLMENLTGGAEYLQFDGIPTTIKLARPGTGSNKALVERPWSDFDRALADATGHKHGYRSDTHGSKHRIEAHCTILELRKMVFEIVRNHNLSPLTTYPVTPEIIREVPDMTPMHLWEYLEAHWGCGITMNKFNRNAYRYSLMQKRSLSVSRKQISYKGILYWDIGECPELISRALMYQDKKQSVEIRYDTRTVSKIYYKGSDGTIFVLPLAGKRSNMKAFASMRWQEFDKWYSEVYLPQNKENEKEKERGRQARDRKMRKMVEESASKAPQITKKSNSQEIRKAGTIERKAVTLFDNAMRDDIFGSDGLALPKSDKDVIDVDSVEVMEEKMKAIDISPSADYASIMGIDPDDM